MDRVYVCMNVSVRVLDQPADYYSNKCTLCSTKSQTSNDLERGHSQWTSWKMPVLVPAGKISHAYYATCTSSEVN